MYIYILMILISTFCVMISEKITNKKFKKVIIGIGLIIPIFMAACRKIGVGTDTKYYISLDFYNAQKFISFFEYFKYSENEFLYLLLSYIVSRFTSNIQIWFGVIQTIVIILMYMIAKRYKKYAPVWFSYMLLMLLYYNKSLNMLRQLIACLIILYAFSYLLEKKYKIFCLFTCIAMGFHITAIIGFGILCIYVLTKNKPLNMAVLLMVLVLLLFNFSNIINSFVNIGILAPKYANYTLNDKINVSSTELVFKIAMFVLITIFMKGLYKKDNNNIFFYYLIIIDVLLYFFGFFYNYVERFSYYFGVFQIMNLIQIPNLGKYKHDVKWLKIIIICCMIMYSYLMYGILKLDETVPYILFLN